MSKEVTKKLTERAMLGYSYNSGTTLPPFILPVYLLSQLHWRSLESAEHKTQKQKGVKL